MNTNTSKPSFNRKGILVTFLILCSLLLAENVCSQKKHWNNEYVKVLYNDQYRCIVMIIEVFDYKFGDAGEYAYLEYCDFAYSYDGINYNNFMQVETHNQNYLDITVTYLQNKLLGADLRFSGWYSPELGTKWSDKELMKHVEVKTKDNLAFLTMRWFVGQTPYQHINFIRLTGRWSITRQPSQDIKDEVYLVYLPSQAQLKSKQNFFTTPDIDLTKNNSVKLYKYTDAVVVEGAELGEIIKVYSVSGAQIKSIVTNNESVKINLPANQTYLVHVGKSRYKFAL